MELIGKRITLPKGQVVNVTGWAIVNGEISDSIVTIQRDDSDYVGILLRKVAEALPETLRRDSFVYRPGK